MLDYLWMVRRQPLELYLALIAAAFLGLGIALGVRLTARRHPPVPPGNPRVVDALGISPRELGVLRELAAGRSNKEIAIALDVSPNTVKTHVARLFRKLDVGRRTEAIGRARDLGLLP